MKKLLESILPRVQKYSKQINDESILKNKQWVLIDEHGITFVTYIFRDKNLLLVSKKGNVSKGSWEYISKDKILITVEDKTYLYRNQYFDDKILLLKKDSSELYDIFINDSLIDEGYDSLEKLEILFKKSYLVDEAQKNSKISSSYNSEVNILKDESKDTTNGAKANGKFITKLLITLLVIASLVWLILGYL
ncbi:hypothetical protein [Sphingobacterium sp.]|uniref:hypothetical protein n=1 Tax=Sphingobacterium sp. TaxID=341027 RepID=UPI00289CAEEB|nr:hypothetical protein [Sphingobacterium sp.]